MDRAAENSLRAGEDIDIAALREPLPENAFLACPRGYCAASSALASPVFAIGAERLYQAWLTVVAAEPRVTPLVSDAQRRRIVVLQRSAVLRFPDVVIAEFAALAPERSSIAVYSRARYGRADFGVNRGRVTAWLQRLERIASPLGNASQ